MSAGRIPGIARIAANRRRLFALAVCCFTLLRLWIIYSQNLVVLALEQKVSSPLMSALSLTVGGVFALLAGSGLLRPQALAAIDVGVLALASALVCTLDSTSPGWIVTCALGVIGASEGLSYVLAGLAFAQLGATSALGAASCTVLCTSIACVGLSFIGMNPATFAVGLIPVLLAAAAVLLGHEVDTEITPSASNANAAVKPHLGNLLVALAVNGIVIRMLDATAYSRGYSDVISVACFTSQVVVGIAAVVLFCTSNHLERNAALAYRCVLPLMAVGFLLLALLRQDGLVVSMPLIYFSHELLEIVFWTALVTEAVHARRPLLALGLGSAAVLFSMAVGTTIGGWLAADGFANDPATLTAVALCCVVVLLVVTIMVLPESLFLSIVTRQSTDSLDAPADNPGTPNPSDVPAARPLDELAATAGLTPRETEVFALLANGECISCIMERLTISRGTANTHVTSVYRKTGVHSQQELLAWVAAHLGKTDRSPEDI